MEFNPTHFLKDGTPCKIVADAGQAGVVVELEGVCDSEHGCYEPIYKLVESVLDADPLIKKETELSREILRLEKRIEEEGKELGKLARKVFELGRESEKLQENYQHLLRLQVAVFADLNPETWAVIEHSHTMAVRQVKHLSFAFEYDSKEERFIAKCSHKPIAVFDTKEEAVVLGEKLAKEKGVVLRK